MSKLIKHLAKLQTRAFATSSASNPTIAALESRWTRLPEAEQGAIADTLLEKQKGDWKQMTLEEKRAAYYIAYGNYGPRAPRDPAFDRKVFGWVSAFILASGAVWLYLQTKSNAFTEH